MTGTRRVLWNFLGLFMLVAITGCATTIPKENLASVKTITIKSSFGADPNYTKVGTTVFSNEYGTFKSEVSSEYVTQRFAALLKAKGYVVLTDVDAGTKADLTLSLAPCGIYGLPYTSGYGVYERSLIGVAVRTITYACVSMVPLMNGQAKCDTCNAHSTSELPFDRLPPNWQFVGPQSRAVVMRMLKRDIDDAASEVLRKSGLL